MNVAIRRLATGDEPRAAEVVTLFKLAAPSLPRLARFLANPHNYLVVAEVGDELAGFLVAYRLNRLDCDADQLFVYEVEVAPALRRRRIGTRLMEWVRRAVDEEELIEAFVLTDTANPAAMGLYGSTGAQVEGDNGVLYVYPGHIA